MARLGLPARLYPRVQATLLSCGPFDSDATLRALFVDERLAPWRDKLPEASSRANRVQAAIAALAPHANRQGMNALALFLTVLSETISPGDSCHDELLALAGEVARWWEVGPEPLRPISAPSPAPTDIPSLRVLLQKLDDVELDALCLDHFPEVYDQFGRGLRRDEKLNLLLNYVRKRPQEAEELGSLLQSQ